MADGTLERFAASSQRLSADPGLLHSTEPVELEHGFGVDCSFLEQETGNDLVAWGCLS